jgi:hypothetical protein
MAAAAASLSAPGFRDFSECFDYQDPIERVVFNTFS